MPYIGRTSFLHCYDTHRDLMNDVSMPYIGRTSFLLYQSRLFTPAGCIVSMPYIGRTSFLLKADTKKPCEEYCVNALYRAHFISTILQKC